MLPFEQRQKSRLRARLQSGEEIGLFLERGAIAARRGLPRRRRRPHRAHRRRAGGVDGGALHGSRRARPRGLPPRQPPLPGRHRRGLAALSRRPRARRDAARHGPGGDSGMRRRSSPRRAPTRPGIITIRARRSTPASSTTSRTAQDRRNERRGRRRDPTLALVRLLQLASPSVAHRCLQLFAGARVGGGQPAPCATPRRARAWIGSALEHSHRARGGRGRPGAR